MKQLKLKGHYLLLPVLMIVLLVSSCKKSETPAPPVIPKPTIASFTPTAAETGETVTITGTNFTGASAVSFGGTAAASYSVVNATTITAVIAAGASGEVKVVTSGGAVTLAGFTLKAPKINGYNNSNEVGKDNLIAHWTFDDTKNEIIASIAPEKSVGTNAFVAGRIGKALSLTDSYLIFPTIPSLNDADALPSFTISLWAKVPDNTSTLSSLFQINGVDFQDLWPMIGVATRTNGNVYSLGAGTTHVNGTGTHPTYADAFLDPGKNPEEGFSSNSDGWAYITVTYDGPSNKLTYFGNGVKLGERILANVVAPETLALLTPNKISFGTFTFIEDFPDGQWGNPPKAEDQPWASHGITATLDDTRIFNVALSDADIVALYNLGQAGR